MRSAVINAIATAAKHAPPRTYQIILFFLDCIEANLDHPMLAPLLETSMFCPIVRYGGDERRKKYESRVKYQ